MLRALLTQGVRPDLIVGTSVSERCTARRCRATRRSGRSGSSRPRGRARRARSSGQLLVQRRDDSAAHAHAHAVERSARRLATGRSPSGAEKATTGRCGARSGCSRPASCCDLPAGNRAALQKPPLPARRRASRPHHRRPARAGPAVRDRRCVSSACHRGSASRSCAWSSASRPVERQEPSRETATRLTAEALESAIAALAPADAPD